MNRYCFPVAKEQFGLSPKMFVAVIFYLSAQIFASPAFSQSPSSEAGAAQSIDRVFIEVLAAKSRKEAASGLSQIRNSWDLSYMPMVLEILGYTRSGAVRSDLIDLLEDKTGQSYDSDISDWYFWLWNQEVQLHPSYAEFKATLYRSIDLRFDTYFRGRQHTGLIRLDEIRWGGVLQDGIPPLRNPQMVAAQEATYLEDDNIVFGIEINGDARAYPKRILAWHEMFTDTIGGVPIAGVYCTLCGTVIPFKTRTEDAEYELGTSGFLYRSNKLMYDKATQSLWSTTKGEPVLGPLASKGIKLEYESVVTTTWGDWKQRHSDTTVLSLNTGFRRDYGEGVAYKDYFSTDSLMFNTPFKDDRLDNKREVLALRFFAAPNEQLAIDTEFLKKNPVYEGQIGTQKFVVLTDSSGANRVFDPDNQKFAEYDGGFEAIDEQGNVWQVEEEWLMGKNGKRLARLPYHRAFWFGWQAAFPNTQLIK